MQAISVKELRENLPAIRGELKKGESFLIIHKSKPIAKLEPISQSSDFREATLEEVELTSAKDWLEMYPPPTKEEDAYYMSLPPFKGY